MCNFQEQQGDLNKNKSFSQVVSDFSINIFFPYDLFEVEKEKEKTNMGRVHLYLASFANCLFQNLSAWVVKHLRVHC